MKTMTVRGLDPALAESMRQQAANAGISLNQWVLKLLRSSCGLEKPRLYADHRDLDALAGTWTAQEAAEFTRSLEPFSRIDDEQWQ